MQTNRGAVFTHFIVRSKSFKPLSTSLRISMHPMATWSTNVHFTLGGTRQKSGFNIKGICGTEWYRLLTCFELYPCSNLSYQRFMPRYLPWR